MIKQLFKFLTGGRPMTYKGYAFNDHISNRSVCYYQDLYDRYWLAYGPWSIFRVSSKESHVGSYERLKEKVLNKIKGE